MGRCDDCGKYCKDSSDYCFDCGKVKEPRMCGTCYQMTITERFRTSVTCLECWKKTKPAAAKVTKSCGSCSKQFVGEEWKKVCGNCFQRGRVAAALPRSTVAGGGTSVASTGCSSARVNDVIGMPSTK